MFRPTTVRMKKQFLRLTKGAALVIMTARIYSFMYSSFNFVPTGPTGRLLTERRTDEVAAPIEGPSCAAVGKRVATKEECKTYAKLPDLIFYPLDNVAHLVSGCSSYESKSGDVFVTFNEGTNAQHWSPSTRERIVCMAILSEIEGASCADVGKRVVTEEECKAHADVSGLPFHQMDIRTFMSGCVYLDHGAIFFNKNTDTQVNHYGERILCMPSTSAVNGNPLFLGIQGQIFKFDGKSDAWYANLSSKSVQWNMHFKKFKSCPKDEDMFITRMGLLLDSKHKVSVGVVDEEIFSPGCADGNVCLGEGSLYIEINNEVFHSPGEYKLANNAGRVVVHNTYASCSRKWYDYDTSIQAKHSGDSDWSFVNNDHQVAGMDLLYKNIPNMLDVEDCHSWMEKRAQNEDLFLQNGGWSTIYIETTDISLHMEYRQTDETCNSHRIDTWISKVSPELLGQEWSGILGETRYPKFDPNGKLIKSDRKVLLAGHDDVDYEVASQYDTYFYARKVLSVDPSADTE